MSINNKTTRKITLFTTRATKMEQLLSILLCWTLDWRSVSFTSERLWIFNFQVSWKKVIQGTCCQFEKLFFLGRATIYFAWPEPLPWAFFADKHGWLTRLDELDLGDLEQLCGDLDEPCWCLCLVPVVAILNNFVFPGCWRRRSFFAGRWQQVEHRLCQ